MFFVTVIMIYITYIFYLLLLLLVLLLLLSMLIKNIKYFHLHFQSNVLTLNRSLRVVVNVLKGSAEFVVYILYVFQAEGFHWCTGCGGDEILCSTWWTVAVIFN
jgi:hypothetical protein